MANDKQVLLPISEARPKMADPSIRRGLGVALGLGAMCACVVALGAYPKAPQRETGLWSATPVVPTVAAQAQGQSLGAWVSRRQPAMNDHRSSSATSTGPYGLPREQREGAPSALRAASPGAITSAPSLLGLGLAALMVVGGALSRFWQPPRSDVLTTPQEWVMAAASSDPPAAEAGDSARVAVLGDLHLDPAEMDLFHECRGHVVSHLDDSSARTHVISLGDLGGYHADPGSQKCFDRSKEFLNGFGRPYNLVLGNHDLESVDFLTDEENLNAWKQTFESEPYWATEISKNTVCVGISTVRFRESPGSVHEVWVDQAQYDWFESTIAKYADWNVFVFTHAPIMGCDLKALQKVHIKNMCAWLNHTDRPGRFIDLVKRSPQIKAWFSGHFHLSHDYQDSISVVDHCAFVQVGVMGESSQRDQRRQSRLLDVDAEGYRVYSVNHHLGGQVRLDLEHKYADPLRPKPKAYEVCADEKGFVAMQDTGMFVASVPTKEDGCTYDETGKLSCWLHTSTGALLQEVDNQLLEYDPVTEAPLGLVHLDLNNREIVLEDSGNVLLVQRNDDGPDEIETINPNPDGTYRQVFQFNKWKARLEQEAIRRRAERDSGKVIEGGDSCALPIPY